MTKARLREKKANPIAWAEDVLGEPASPVPGWPGIFATRTGRIFSSRRSGKELKQSESNGYKFIMVRDEEGRSRILHVHRAALLAWRGEPKKGEETRHLDGDRSNNTFANLAWGSRLENARDRIRHGTSASGLKSGAYTKPASRRRGSKNGMAVVTEKEVKEFRERYAAGVPAAVLCEEYGISRSSFLAACNGRTWTHVGGPITKKKTVREVIDND